MSATEAEVFFNFSGDAECLYEFYHALEDASKLQFIDACMANK
jgi:hypothetical protein